MHVRSGETTYIGVRVLQGFKLSCAQEAVFHFGRPQAEDAETWAQAAHPWTPDPDEGRALFARAADVTRAYLAMARAKLEARR